MQPFKINRKHWTFRLMDWWGLKPWERTDLCSYGRGMALALTVFPAIATLKWALITVVCCTVLFALMGIVVLPYRLAVYGFTFKAFDNGLSLTGTLIWGVTLLYWGGVGVLWAIGRATKSSTYPSPLAACLKSFREKTCVRVEFD